MSLKTIFSQVCERLGDTRDISKKFAELKNDEDRFTVTHDVCNTFISNLSFETVRKSSEKSGKVRKLGNENFAKNVYWEALKLYNESIALAPDGSEELSLAYGNRAACLLRLGFPEEALADVEGALKLPATNDFRNKLLLRKEKCLHLIKSNKRNIYLLGGGNIVPLSRGKSSFFDSASELIGFSFDEYWERKLVANDHIKVGEVLIVERPYSSVLLPNHLYTHCSNCFKRSVNLIPCNNCCTAMFCNEECMRIATKSYHKIECHILDILIKLKAEKMELLSLRILICASNQGESLEKLYKETKEYGLIKNNNNENSQFYKSLDYINIYNLVKNSDKRTASDLFYRSVISMVLISLLEKNTSFFISTKEEKRKLFCGGLILGFMQSLPCNAHEISEFCEDGLEEIGAGAYATLSLINHSCDPNVVRYSCGDVVVLRAIRPIEKGAQIFDNYGYHYATHLVTERQNALRKQYYFKCECEACSKLWPTYENLPETDLLSRKEIDLNLYKKLTNKFEENLEKIFKGTYTPETIVENMKYLDYLDEFIERPWKNYNKCQEAIKQCWSFFGNHFRSSKGIAS